MGTALAMERAVQTGTLLTTGLLLKLSRCIIRTHKITPSCSRRFTSLLTTMLGTATNTMAASATKDTVVPVVRWWSALQTKILLTTSAIWPLRTPPRSPTSSCSTTHRSVPKDGRRLTLWSQAQLEMEVNRTLWKTAITTAITFLTKMAARCTDKSWNLEKDGAFWDTKKETPAAAPVGIFEAPIESSVAPSVESFVSSESLGSKVSLASRSSGNRPIRGRRKEEKIPEKKELRWGTVKKKQRKVKQIVCGNVYQTKTRCKVTEALKKGSREVWTIPRGTHVEVQEINFEEKRCYVYCECEYYSKYDDRSAGPRVRYVEGWMSYKDNKGWVLWL